MGTLGLIQIVIGIVQGILAGLTTANAPQETLAALGNAIAELKKVHGTLVTKAQVDAHTFEYKW